jgi:hypothetical protein
MKKFADFGIKLESDKNIFPVTQISIHQILNCEIKVLDFAKDVKTRHGDGRYVVKIEHNGSEYKFFTAASKLKEALNQIPKSNFPFIATVKAETYGGNNKAYYFE